MRINLNLFKRKRCSDLLELKESIECKDEILKECKKIRHEYNNMLQSIISFIEEEDWKGLCEYKESLLTKTRLMNKSNFTQLVKIKDNRVLILIYKLLERANETGVGISLVIYNDVYDADNYKINFYEVLRDYLNYAYERASEESKDISLKIDSNEQGFRFAFENTYSNENLEPEEPRKDIKKFRNVFFNTFLQDGKHIQEILILIK